MKILHRFVTNTLLAKIGILDRSLIKLSQNEQGCNFLPARRYASAGNRHSNVSVRPSVTRWYCVKTKKASGMISSPSGSPKTLVL